MTGGAIEVHGNASDYVGAPYRGSTKGMHGGKMTIYGNVGNEAGAWMKKGTIKVYGSAGQFVGFRMHNGTIYVQNDCEARAGACMTDGKIVAGGCIPSVLPSFTIDSTKPRVKIEENETIEGPFYLFFGDLAEGGKGKLYVSKVKNQQLTCYEKLL
jgi:formylmethanofuran dehydrogenase subunit C